MENINKFKTIRILILIFLLIIIISLIVYLFPVMRNLSTYEGQLEFKEKVENSGVYGFLTLLALQFAQIFLVIVPGEPLEILAGMCYGAIGGTIFILFSVAITTTIIFLIVRRFGKKFIYQSFDKSKIDRIEKSKIFQNPGKIEFIYVDPDKQGRGIATMLMEKALNKLKRPIKLEVFTNNKQAKSLYKKFGFKTIKTVTEKWSDEYPVLFSEDTMELE